MEPMNQYRITLPADGFMIATGDQVVVNETNQLEVRLKGVTTAKVPSGGWNSFEPYAWTDPEVRPKSSLRGAYQADPEAPAFTETLSAA